MQKLTQEQLHSLFTRLAVGDIRHDTYQTPSVAVRATTYNLPTACQPDGSAIGSNNSVLGGEVIHLVRLIIKLQDERTVIGMDGRYIFVLLAPDSSETARKGYSEQRHRFFCPRSRLINQIRFPRPHSSGDERRTISCFALSQRNFRFLSVGDVEIKRCNRRTSLPFGPVGSRGEPDILPVAPASAPARMRSNLFAVVYSSGARAELAQIVFGDEVFKRAQPNQFGRTRIRE